MRSAAVCWEFAAGFAVSGGGDYCAGVFGLASVVEEADAACAAVISSVII